ncbi:MAG: FkbM family methyltransferase [Candidatus Staskawiczbacteria bacterium]|nr:FkbM family methyltransferase [Candidatus Staskawiczbacteria bacterium]MBI3337240.1 FkbM family methyltransferase [Candidatus Staskawiczbacteria bacterium]
MDNQRVKPFISVIIPTRERADTLLFAIKTALDQNSDDYEVVVSDNFSQDNTKEVVESFNDSRLVYVNSGRRLSMCDNYEFALEHAKGEYMIFIGDDDAIMPGAIDMLQNTIKSSPNLVYCWPMPLYTWPKNDLGASAYYLSPDIHPFEISLKKLAARFIAVMRESGQLPSVYHGAVAKSILDIIRKQTGRVFHSTQPDLFTSFAIPVFCDTAINVGYAVTVSGRSPKSNSAVAYGKDSRVNTEKMIQEYKNYQIHPSLFPGIDILANVLQDAILVAMDKFPQCYDNLHFNYNAMWAFIVQQSGYFKWNISIKEIIQKREQIRKYHPFSILQFFKYVMTNKFVAFWSYRNPVALYRSFSRKIVGRGPFANDAPGNISDFVKQLADYQNNLTIRKKTFNHHYIARSILSLKKNLLYPETVRQEKRELIFYSQFIKKGDVCFDVGANIGNKTNIFLKLGAKVIAVEPQELACQKIQEFYGDNKNLVVVNKGLAANSGFMELSIGEDRSVLATMSEKWKKEGCFSKSYKGATIEKVPVTTLDNLISKHGLPKFCKIDVEGFEKEVLKGLTKLIPYISFEFTKEFLVDAKECVDYVSSLGNATFNYSVGESGKLSFKDWVLGAELFEALEKIENKDVWGDIYVNFKQSTYNMEHKEVKLHLGCGSVILPGYINIDNTKREGISYDIDASILDLQFNDNSVDEIKLHHVFEHFHRYQAVVLMFVFNRWLKRGGKLEIATPDFEWCARKYLGLTSPMEIIWNTLIAIKYKKNYFKTDKWKILRQVFGSKESGWGSHLEGWDRFTLTSIYKLFGFRVVKVTQSKYKGWSFPAIVVVGEKERHIDNRAFEALAKSFLEKMVANDLEFPVWLSQAMKLKEKFLGNQNLTATILQKKNA